MSKEAMKQALGKIKSARDCHPNAVDTLLFEAEEILEGALAEQPAQQQEPVALLPKVDVCMRAEAHGIDPKTKGLYGFYVDCISSSPQPAPVQQGPVVVRDAIVVNLVREGINKHRAKELADHFIGLAAPQPAQPKEVVAQAEIKAARKKLEDKWDAEGHCRSCGWHAALYEHDVTDSDIAEALASFGGILQLGCRSKDDDDNDLHRGVRVNLRD